MLLYSLRNYDLRSGYNFDCFKIHAKWGCGKHDPEEEQNIEHPQKIARAFVSQKYPLLKRNLPAGVNIFSTWFGAAKTFLRGLCIH